MNYCPYENIKFYSFGIRFKCVKDHGIIFQLPDGLIRLLAQLVRALHRYRRGHGCESCTSLNFFLFATTKVVYITAVNFYTFKTTHFDMPFNATDLFFNLLLLSSLLSAITLNWCLPLLFVFSEIQGPQAWH